VKLNLKIYSVNSSIDVARDWGIEAETATAQEVLAQPFSIACVPACYTQSWNFAYDSVQAQVDLSRFDLVIVSDIEQERVSQIKTWLVNARIKNYVIALGAHHNSESIDYDSMVYRPWWMYNLMRLNQPQHIQPLTQDRPFWFDILLGARRPHRDFVMLSLQKHSCLLEKTLITYRSGFIGDVIDNQTKIIHNYFPDQILQWPYVSNNLDNAWEVQETFDKSMSPYVPWKIYDQSWYTVICETAFTGDVFFPTEKISKALYGHRVFVTFAACEFLKDLQELGFETFGSVIDESYDSEGVDLERYKKAFAAMTSLTWQDPKKVYEKIQPVLQHNHYHMQTLQAHTQNQMSELLQQKIPAKFISAYDR
jgi:hypothetical protein